LTVLQHLNIFGAMKGLSGQELKEATEYFVNVMQLKDYVNVKAG